MFDASTDGERDAAVALQEWEVFSTRARPARRPSVKGAATEEFAVALYRRV